MKSPYEKTASEWLVNERPATGLGWWDKLVVPFLQVVDAADPAARVLDIKEKWGVLNIFVASSLKCLETMSDTLEGTSKYVCEECGRWNGEHRDGDEIFENAAEVTTGELIGRRWIKTYCTRCRIARYMRDEAEQREFEKRQLNKTGGDVA